MDGNSLPRLLAPGGWPSVRMAESLLVGAVLTVLSLAAGRLAGVPVPSTLEIAAVATSFACTYLCVVQSRWNYPMGAVTTALYAWLLYDAQLYASMMLNCALCVWLAYGWWRWGPDDETRPVTSLLLSPRRSWLVPLYLAGTLAFWLAVMGGVGYFSGEALISAPDAGIFALTVLAQILLDNKRIETWPVWVAVNLLSLWVYSGAGLWLVVAQYVLFLLNTLVGWRAWRQSQWAEHEDIFTTRPIRVSELEPDMRDDDEWDSWIERTLRDLDTRIDADESTARKERTK